MKARGKVAAALLAVALLAACGQDVADDGEGAVEPSPTETTPTVEPSPTDEPTDPTEEPTDMDDESRATQQLTGTLGGDQQLEGGCAWLETRDGARYEVFWPEGYQLEWSPLQLVGPDGEVVAGEGEQITVAGRTSTDMASICMVGTIFEATEVDH